MLRRFSLWVGKTHMGISFIRILDLLNQNPNLFKQHNYTLRTPHSHKEHSQNKEENMMKQKSGKKQKADFI